MSGSKRERKESLALIEDAYAAYGDLWELALENVAEAYAAGRKAGLEEAVTLCLSEAAQEHDVTARYLASKVRALISKEPKGAS